MLTVKSLLAPTGGNAYEVYTWLKPWLDQQSAQLPFGYRYEIGGEVEESLKANASIADKLGIAGMIIILLLLVQFNSIRKPLIIFLTIPLGLIGVVIGLFLGKSYLGFMTLLGIVSLSGIVVNNAIVLLDRIKIEQDQFNRSPRMRSLNPLNAGFARFC